MRIALVTSVLIALLAGCAIVPVGYYGYRDDHHHYRGDGYYDRDRHYYRGGWGYRGYGYRDHGQ